MDTIKLLIFFFGISFSQESESIEGPGFEDCSTSSSARRGSKRPAGDGKV